MSAKNVNETVTERRIRPILDCLEVQDNKKALHESEKLLKKQNDLHVAKILKGLCLLRLGQKEECIRIVSQVHEQQPTEICALRAMRACYIEMQRVDLLCEAYENAIKKNPTDLDLHLQLHGSYIQQSNFKKAQQLALAMSKRFSSGPYFSWSIVGLYLQTLCPSDQSLNYGTLLSLARRLLEKSFEPKQFPSTEVDFELYLQILDLQKDYTRALEVIGHSISFVNDKLGFISRREAIYHIRLNQPIKAFDRFVKLVHNFPDQMDNYDQLIYIALDLIASKIDEEQTKLNFSLNENPNDWELFKQITDKKSLDQQTQINPVKIDGRDLLKDLITLINKSSSQNSPTARTLLIAKMNLLGNLRNTDLYESTAQQLNGDGESLLYEYYIKYGNKPASMFEMFSMASAHQLDPQQCEQLAQKMEQHFQNTQIDNLDNLFRYSCLMSMQINAGRYQDPLSEASINVMRSLLTLHDQARNWAAGKLKTDFNSAEYLILLTTQILDQQVLTNNTCLWNALACLFKATRVPCPNYTQKLILLQAYSAAGAALCATDIFQQLDLKHIQRDSLGYLVYSTSEAAVFNQANRLQLSALLFFNTAIKDTNDQLLNCFQCSSYGRIEELLRLRNRFLNSIHHAYVNSARPLLHLITSCKTPEVTNQWLVLLNVDPLRSSFGWNHLFDNRDFSILRKSVLSVHQRSVHNISVTYHQLFLLCQVRNLNLRLLIGISLFKSVSHRQIDLDSYKHLLQRYTSLVEHCHTIDRGQLQSTLFGPLSVGFDTLVQSGTVKVLADAFQLPVDLAEQPDKLNEQTLQTTIVDPVTAILDQLKDKHDQIKHLFEIGPLFEFAHWTLEMLGILVVITQLLWLQHNPISDVSTSNTATKKSKNKKKITPVCPPHVTFIIKLVARLEQFYIDLRKIVQEFSFTHVLDFQKHVSANHYIFESQTNHKTMNEIRKQLDSSYELTKKEYLETIQQKLKSIAYMQKSK